MSKLRDQRTVFGVPGFLPLWITGICWHWGRWGIAFLAAYHVNDLTDSPRMVQLTGTAMWAPLLLGGAIGGVVADRFDRLATVRVQLIVLVPVVILVGGLEISHNLNLWVVYPFLVIAGVGWVGDMTSRRSLVLDIVGPSRIDSAMALESIALASGAAVGNLIGGFVAQNFGVGVAFLVIAFFLIIGLISLGCMPDLGLPEITPKSERPSPLAELREAVELAKNNRGLRSIIGVTVLTNFFFFAYFPAVQRIGADINASPTQIGLIASMSGFGMMVGSVILGWWSPERRGLAYIGGSMFGMVMLIPFALGNSLLAVTGALFVATCGIGFFGATQSTLVLMTVDENMRGRAMGLLSTGIGALPIGAYALGEIAEYVGIRAGVAIMSATGLFLMVLWLFSHPEVLKMGRSV
ncbi:MAG: putative MFS family arabinose efflux permease [Candidatus Poriferisodalaceae bacterium]|jgi:predicted MFS family arabinose efflux permease